MPQPKRRKRVQGEGFDGQRVRLDGKRFERCTFTNCVLEIGGAASFELAGNSFDGRCRWIAVDAASTTLGMLAALYRDPGVRPLIDVTLRSIQDGTIGQDHPADWDLGAPPKLDA